jgi:hypothetical protein
MMCGHPSTEDVWSIRETLSHIGACAESMPINAFQHMHQCLHFADDWEENGDTNWEDLYLDETLPTPATDKHKAKFIMVKDTFNVHWKELVSHGLHITFDKSRVAGWYTSSITIGPDLKPILTGMTLRSMSNMIGLLVTFKLHVHTYNGEEDEDMNKSNPNAGGAGIQKIINLPKPSLTNSWGVATRLPWIPCTYASLLLKLIKRGGS